MTITAQKITDIFEFAAMPDGTVIRDGDGDIGVKRDFPLDLAVRYFTAEGDNTVIHKLNEGVPLPIHVLYHPKPRAVLVDEPPALAEERNWETPEEIPDGVTFVAASVPEVQMSKPVRRWYRVVWPTKFRVRASKLRELGPFTEVKRET